MDMRIILTALVSCWFVACGTGNTDQNDPNPTQNDQNVTVADEVASQAAEDQAPYMVIARVPKSQLASQNVDDAAIEFRTVQGAPDMNNGKMIEREFSKAETIVDNADATDEGYGLHGCGCCGCGWNFPVLRWIGRAVVGTVGAVLHGAANVVHAVGSSVAYVGHHMISYYPTYAWKGANVGYRYKWHYDHGDYRYYAYYNKGCGVNPGQTPFQSPTQAPPGVEPYPVGYETSEEYVEVEGGAGQDGYPYYQDVPPGFYDYDTPNGPPGAGYNVELVGGDSNRYPDREFGGYWLQDEATEADTDYNTDEDQPGTSTCPNEG